MCGICGLVAPGLSEPALRRRVRAMSGALRQRGPDGRGLWLDPSVGIGLGHRRLAVLDRSPAAAQPMRSDCGRYVLCYNGELYGFRPLRDELARGGARFRGHGDGEVLLAAIARWGLEPALERVDGMFAFALWDAHERRLSLVRDRVGKKPLYYAELAGGLLFGSQLAALHAHPQFRPEIDPLAVAGLLRDSFIPAPHSIYRGVHKLEPGSLLHVRVGEGATCDAPRRWFDWKPEFEAGARRPRALAPEEALAGFDERLRVAVADRLLADVPVGALLSGGVDSAAVVTCMRDLVPGTLRTFTIGSPDRAFDESAAARRLAQRLGCEHHTLVATPRRARDLLPELPSLFDEPFADTSMIPTALAARLARGSVTVALSGDGGDELLLGYDRYYACRRRWRLLGPLPAPLRRGLARGLLALDPLRGERLADALVARDLEDLFARANARHPDPGRLVPAAVGGPRPAPGRPLGAGDALQRLAWLDWDGRLPESILVKVDRASMGVGLEVRSPLLDARLVRFCAALPTARRCAGGAPKGLLRQWLVRRLPGLRLGGPKRGFGVPLGSWLRGPLRDWAEAMLSPQALARGGLLEVAAVRALWAQHLEGRRDRRFLLWNLLCLQAWQSAGPPLQAGRDAVPWAAGSSRRRRRPMQARGASATGAASGELS